MATNSTNGPSPPQTVQEQSAIPTASDPPQISGSIIQGAHRFTEIFEKRTAALRADYEERIRALAIQRDALLAASQGQIPQEKPQAASALDMEALQQGSSALLRERADRDRERTSWDQERARWTREQAIVQNERVKLNAKQLEVETERARWNEERARYIAERATFEESLLRLTKERDTILEERERCLQARKDLEGNLGRAQHELQVLKAGYGSLQEQLASKNASVMALETRVQQLEAARTDPSGLSGIRTEAGAPNAHKYIHADGIEDQQEAFNPLAFIRSSPTRGMTPPTISTQSTRLSVKSPSLDPASMQLDESGPRSSIVTLQLGSPPSLDSGVVDSLRDDVLITDPPLVVDSGGSISTTSVITTPPRRLIIRIPPSLERARKSLKPLPLHFTDEEKRNIVHVPREFESDDDNNDGLGTIPETAWTTNL